ncbi:MAG: hypothetical protein AB9891_15560 [Anaerolineaceae bacterium]
MLRLFAATVPGLEPTLSSEITALGLTPRALSPLFISGETRDDAGGVEFEASLRDLYLANLHLRTAGRILYRLGEFRAIGFSELRSRASALPWELFLKPGQAVSPCASPVISPVSIIPMPSQNESWGQSQTA